MKALLLLILPALSLFGLNSCKTVKVSDESYAWKSFDNSEKDQSVDLSTYSSPNDRPGQDPKKLVIVCASGGGSRAASFTTGIMLELEKIGIEQHTKITSNVLDEIDYFSTVSGGGWGASSYLAYLYMKDRYSTPKYQDAISRYNSSLPSKDFKRLSVEHYPTFNSYESYLANRADFRYYKGQIPLILTFWFGAAKSDMKMTNRLNAGYLGRSYRREVESSIWNHMYPGATFREDSVSSITLGDVFKKKGDPSYMPMLITNATNIDNYKLIPFTPDRLEYWGVKQYRHYMSKDFQDVNNAVDLGQIPLASGTKASSGIPFGMSCSTFPATKRDNYSNRDIDYYLHLQDGGIIDQQGMHSAKSILLQNPDIKDKKNRIVLIIDASSSGIDNKKKFKKKNAGRIYNASRVMAPFSTPDSQYPLTRERVKLFEREYNCTVIYLGTEVLIDKNSNFIPASKILPSKKRDVENYFYKKYSIVKNDVKGFLNSDIDERKLLYTYISQNVPTWFNSKGSKFKGKYFLDENSTAKIMFLAGRGVVQLKGDEIKSIFND